MVTLVVKDTLMSRMSPLAVAVLLTGCVDTAESLRPPPHLRPVPHLSDEAKEFLRRTRQDINANYVESMGLIRRQAAPHFKCTEVTLGGVRSYWVTSPKTVRHDAVIVGAASLEVELQDSVTEERLAGPSRPDQFLSR